ncbi:MAG: hypothetical protein Q9218_007866, partial [Villophora microphyllina]
MSLRRLLPVRTKTTVGTDVSTPRDQDSFTKKTNLTEVAQTTEVAIRAPGEIPVSHARTTQPTVEPMCGLGQGCEKHAIDLWSRGAAKSGDLINAPTLGDDGESSKTTASYRCSPEVVRDVRAVPRRHPALTLSPESGKPPDGWEVMLDEEYGLPYLFNHKNGATTLGLSPGWEIREDEKGLLFVDHNTQTVTRTDPRFAVNPVKEATERLALRHTTHPHSCEHCQKITVDFKRSRLNKVMLRSEFDNVRVFCASSIQAISTAQRHGCPLFVRLFHYPLRQSDVSLEDGGVFLTIKRSRVNDEYDETWHKHCFIFYKSEQLRNQARNPRLRLCGDPKPGKPSLVQDLDGPLQVPDVGSPAAFAWARRLLDECDRDHKDCKWGRDWEFDIANRRRAPADFAPSRLVDVAQDPNTVRVIDTRDGPPLDPIYGRAWACLSYAWGGDQIVKTTKANLAKYAAGISLVVLPPTIRDAVKVCRRLGLKYLWVDCLCIVQDNDKDMENELQNMAFIYRQAYVTIIAASASGVWQGFLHDRGYFFNNDDMPPPIQLRCLTSKGEETSLLAFPEPKGRTIEDGNPTEERGWTYQERYLSKRVLYYGFRGLTYMCDLAQDGLESKKHDLSPLNDAEWHEVVEEYSQRQMFEPSKNKFNAISAVALKFCEPEQYAAGLRTKHLVSDLAWRVVRGRRDENLHLRPQTYRAPSWSWVAVDNA